MFEINEDKTINITRGDIGAFTVDALNEAGEKYLFQKGDVVRIKVTEKKACENVMFQKDFVVEEETEQVEILLTEDETKIGEVISKPTDYWYEVELNPLTNPQTIIGYDEDGAKILRLYPEGNDIEPVEPTPEDIPVVDEELDITSERPVQNQAITRAMLNLQAEVERIDNDTNITSEDLEPLVVGIEENKSNIAKNKGNIEDLTSNVEELNNHKANTSNPHNVTAEQTHFDKNISGMSANNVQGAIDEIKCAIGNTNKNLIPYPYLASSYEYNGISYTELGDGRIKANGTNGNSTSSFYLHNYCKQKLNVDKIILSLKSTSGLASVFFRFWREGNVYIEEYDFNIVKQNGEITIDVPSADNYDYWTVELFYEQGTTVVDDIVEIMIRPASIKDDTYEPYVADLKSLSVKTYITEQKAFEITAGNFAEGLFDLPSEIGINEVLGVTILTDGSTYILSNIRSVNKNRIHINFRNVWTGTIGMYAKLLIMYR